MVKAASRKALLGTVPVLIQDPPNPSILASTTNTFFPAFAVFLFARLKLSDSIFLRTQKERIIPYVITMFFYWWMYYLSRNFLDQPIVLKYFYFICKYRRLEALEGQSHCLGLDLNGLLTRRNFGCIPGMLGTYTIPK